MSDETENKDGEKKPKSMMIVVAISIGIGCISGALGFGLFTMLSSTSSAENVPPVELPPDFVEFEEVVVNLEETRMSRYLRVSFELQVKGGEKEAVTEKVETHTAVLRNWVITYLSQLKLDDVSGNSAKNRIRREIQNYCNEVLSDDGIEVVQDILFTDFQVQ